METLINGYSVIWIFREGFNLFNFQSEDEIIYSVDQSHEEKPCQPGNRLQNWWNMSVCVTWAVMHLVITYPLLLPPQPPLEHPTQTDQLFSSSPTLPNLLPWNTSPRWCAPSAVAWQHGFSRARKQHRPFPAAAARSVIVLCGHVTRIIYHNLECDLALISPWELRWTPHCHQM